MFRLIYTLQLYRESSFRLVCYYDESLSLEFTVPQAESLHLVANLFPSSRKSPILDLGQDRLHRLFVAQLSQNLFRFKNETTLRRSRSVRVLSKARPLSVLDASHRLLSPLSSQPPMFSLRRLATRCIQLLSLLQLPLVPFAQTPLPLTPHPAEDSPSRPSQFELLVLAKRVPIQVIAQSVPRLLLPTYPFPLLPLGLHPSLHHAKSPSDPDRSCCNRQNPQRNDFR